MQKRVYNVIRALAESPNNVIKMIHDHGAGGHVNCFSELLEETGGVVSIGKLPVGDPTLSAKEIICNESQERMGIILDANDFKLIEQIAVRERAPAYAVGDVTGDNQLIFEAADNKRAIDVPMELLFGSSPVTVLEDSPEALSDKTVSFSISSGDEFLEAFKGVLSLEGVACKDWLTNKVDRSVTGKIAQQQCVGPLQLPVSDVAVTTIDYTGENGIATSIGHAPVAGLIDEKAGSVLSIAEALTNIVWAPLKDGIEGVSLSANWMWPAKQPGEDARLYRAVEAASQFAIDLGISIPTGKDSLSMTMNYEDGSVVRAPGTVVISAAAECIGIDSIVTPNLVPREGSKLLYVNLSSLDVNPLGGSSFAQTLGVVGVEAPTVLDVGRFKAGFETLQELISSGLVLSGHDVSAGGVVTTVAEMAFAGDIGVSLEVPYPDTIDFLFCEKPAVVIQVGDGAVDSIIEKFVKADVAVDIIGTVSGDNLSLIDDKFSFIESVSNLRRTWFKPSFLLDSLQTNKAKDRFESFDKEPLTFSFPNNFSTTAKEAGVDIKRQKSTGIQAAIIREKGTNGDREMAFSLYASGFDVKDICMTDITSGKETLEDIKFAVFPGGFSNSDVLGAAHGWAGLFKYNEAAHQALKNFYARPDTLSLGVCNGCQLLAGLEDLSPFSGQGLSMDDNDSGKFESSFLTVEITESNSIMLDGLTGARLGIWVAHGEGKMSPGDTTIAMKYTSSTYPQNPNGSEFDTAGVVSTDGRHLAMMPHLERSVFSWQWPYKSTDLQGSNITPWMLAFVNAREWINKNT